MGFCWTTIYVNNLDESLKFYQEIVDLKLDRRFMAGPGREIAFFGDGETKVELIKDESIKDINIGNAISLGFTVNSVNEKMEFIKGKGIEIYAGPIQPNPNVKFFYVLDPNGLKIQFVENIK